jgi:hypothetical protein
VIGTIRQSDATIRHFETGRFEKARQNRVVLWFVQFAIESKNMDTKSSIYICCDGHGMPENDTLRPTSATIRNRFRCGRRIGELTM